LVTQLLLLYNIEYQLVQGEPGFVLAHQLIKRALNIPGASVHWYAKPGLVQPTNCRNLAIVLVAFPCNEILLKEIFFQRCESKERWVILPLWGLLCSL
jgi:phosphoribosylaminoimidazole carboxylase